MVFYPGIQGGVVKPFGGVLVPSFRSGNSLSPGYILRTGADGVDIVGLSVSDYEFLTTDQQTFFFTDATHPKTWETFAAFWTAISAEPWFNTANIMGTEAKGVAVYKDGTAQATIDKAFRYFGFYSGTMSFSFVPSTGIEPSATNVESAAITIPNIAAAKSFTVTGGTAEKNDSDTWANSGSVVAGDTLKLRGNASASYATAATVALSFGADDSTYSITTRAQDITPVAFSFVEQVDLEPATVVESSVATITGIDDGCPVSIVGGEYEINNSGTWTDAAGTIDAGDDIVVRVTTGTYEVEVEATLTVGTGSAAFFATTMDAVTVSDRYQNTIHYTNLGHYI